MSADFKRYLISVLLPSIFPAANCSPGKCFITPFVLFKFFKNFVLVPLILLDPFRPRWGGPFLCRNENQKQAQSFSICRSSQNVMTKIYCIQAMSQFIPKRLHLQALRYFVHKTTFYLDTITYTVWMLSKSQPVSAILHQSHCTKISPENLHSIPSTFLGPLFWTKLCLHCLLNVVFHQYSRPCFNLFNPFLFSYFLKISYDILP